ncbi:MAG TPA: hypothetical protein VK202_06125, partial [Bacteroidia bacterium]|nr:hypothetical protein [Bacteroidia bacterium]
MMNRTPLNRFLLRAAIIFSLWFVFYYVEKADKVFTSKLLSELVVEHSTTLLSVVDSNYHVSVEQRGKYLMHTVCYNTKCLVGVGRACNALELFVLFAGFIIAFPGSVKHKFWFIPVGLVLIHFLNVIR